MSPAFVRERMIDSGRIHIYMGDGKGKSTAAVGLITRMAGCGGQAVFAQFLKGDHSGERAALRMLPHVSVMHVPQQVKFVFQMTPEEKKDYAILRQEFLQEAFEKAASAQLLVLDEALDALAMGLIAEETLRALLENRATGLEVVLTGRDAPKWLQERADYITRMEKRKHPYDAGVQARRGIEY